MAVPAYQIALDAAGRDFLAFDPKGSRGWCTLHFATAPISTLLRIGPRQPEDTTTDPPITSLPLQIAEIRVADLGGIRSLVLRSIPLTRIESAVNMPEHRRAFLDDAVLHWWTWFDPEPIPGYNTADAHRDTYSITLNVPPAPVPIKLEVPTSFRKPNSFYEQVARAFLYLASTGERPARELAEANDVPPSTVHNWVREAKARGLLLLPPTGGAE